MASVRPDPSSPARPRPSVVCVVDHPGWAHDRKTDGLAKALRRQYRVRAVYQERLTARDVVEADVVLAYYWRQWHALKRFHGELWQLGGRFLMGVCSHLELEETNREPGLTTLNRFAGGVFLNSLALYAEFSPLLRPPAFYTPNGVDSSFFRPARHSRPSTGFRVGWAGSLLNHSRTHRGYDAFIVPAVARVEGAELVTAAREDHWRSAAEMLDFYRSLDVYVCASLSEGTPNPCLEASACGVPIVTTAVGNMPQFVEDGVNGFLVDRHVDVIADRLQQLRSSTKRKREMGRAARRAAIGWDWKIQAQRYGQMFAHGLTAHPIGEPRLLLDGVRRLVSSHRALHIWGAGAAGLAAKRRMEAEGIAVAAFIDSDARKAGTTHGGVAVVSAACLGKDCTPQSAAVVVASAASADMAATLENLGWTRDADYVVLPHSALTAQG